MPQNGIPADAGFMHLKGKPPPVGVQPSNYLQTSRIGASIPARCKAASHGSTDDAVAARCPDTLLVQDEHQPRFRASVLQMGGNGRPRSCTTNADTPAGNATPSESIESAVNGAGTFAAGNDQAEIRPADRQQLRSPHERWGVTADVESLTKWIGEVRH